MFTKDISEKEVIIFDYEDFDIPVLAKMFARRRAGYRSIGYEIVSPENKSRAVQLALESQSSDTL